MLQYSVPEIVEELAVSLECWDDPFLNEKLAEQVDALMEMVKNSPASAERSNDFLVPVFAEEDGLPTFYIELVSFSSLLLDFSPIKQWDEIDLDMFYEYFIGPHLWPSFWNLEYSGLVGLIIHLFKLKPLPISWGINDFPRILNANIYGRLQKVAVERAIAQYLLEKGPFCGGRTHLPAGKFSIPRNGPDPWDEMTQDDFINFRGDVFSWISYYQEIRDLRKDLLNEINSKGY